MLLNPILIRKNILVGIVCFLNLFFSGIEINMVQTIWLEKEKTSFLNYRYALEQHSERSARLPSPADQPKNISETNSCWNKTWESENDVPTFFWRPHLLRKKLTSPPFRADRKGGDVDRRPHLSKRWGRQVFTERWGRQSTSPPFSVFKKVGTSPRWTPGPPAWTSPPSLLYSAAGLFHILVFSVLVC